jgi:hypothetical protein
MTWVARCPLPARILAGVICVALVVGQFRKEIEGLAVTGVVVLTLCALYHLVRWRERGGRHQDQQWRRLSRWGHVGQALGQGPTRIASLPWATESGQAA